MKDKVNLIAMCAFENNVEDIEERKNAFTKKMEKVGSLKSRRRVMIFEDNDVAIDTKTHFEYITPKIELGARNFIDAVEEAIAKKLEAIGEAPAKKKSTVKKSTKKPEPAPVVEEEETDDLTEMLKAVVNNEPVETDEDEANEVPFDIEDEAEDNFEEVEETIEEDAVITLDDDRLNAIRAAYKTANADAKAKVKKHLANYNNKLSAEMKASDVNAIEEILGLNDEV